RLAESPGAVVSDDAVDAVVVATRHGDHASLTIEALEAGKHVFCEKPLALTRDDAREAVAACNANRVALAVGHERRFEPPIVELLRMLRAGEIGNPLQVEANFSQDKFLGIDPKNWRLSPREAPAGPLTATGIHLLDLSVAVFGEAESAFASVRQLGSPLVNGDTLAVLLAFRNGGHALISAMLATPFVGRFALYGSHGWIEVRDRAHPEAPEGWELVVCRRGGRPEPRAFPPARAVLANLEAFAEAALGGAPYPVPQEQMIANICALEAVVRSTRSGAVERVEAVRLGG
ncbi:MAG: Gfo/Idh/MocA family oxidoreductase, partial [Burkholderiales bacterium]|nr:Gfo/Idh/MocA family oxidoreductase [Burkholderiales bacterium]